jgi:uncharacterized protein YukJ
MSTSAPKNKPVKNYGVWHARPVEYRTERDSDDPNSPHIYLTFRDKSQEDFEAAINIKSGDKKESRLVYWINEGLDASVIKDFEGLSPGFHSLSGKKGLDYLRDEGLFVEEEGLVLPHDIPGRDNDIIDKLTPLLDRAINEKATIYIFGSKYPEPPRRGSLRGLHEVHQNQGSLPKFSNSVQTDGALIFHFEEADEGKGWVGVFLAFASQRKPTDDKTGLALPDSKSWAEILGAEEDEEEEPDA